MILARFRCLASSLTHSWERHTGIAGATLLLFLFCLAPKTQAASGWETILDVSQWKVTGRYSLRAYSEFLPAPISGARPYELRLDAPSSLLKNHSFSKLFKREEPESFGIDPFDDFVYLRPGLEAIVRPYLLAVKGWIAGNSRSPFPSHFLKDNPYWPTSMKKAPQPLRLIAFLPVSVARTQDEFGKSRWTLLGGAGRTPDELFFSTFVRCESLLNWLRPQPTGKPEPFDVNNACEVLKKEGIFVYSKAPLSGELAHLSFSESKPAASLRLLVTVEPIQQWPRFLRERFLSGEVEAAPYPATMIPWGVPSYAKLSEMRSDAWELPLAVVLSPFGKRANDRLLVPEALALDSPAFSASSSRHKPLKNSRNASKRIFQKLFDFSPDQVELYGKPSARNSQIWGTGGVLKDKWLLHGPLADRDSIDAVKEGLQKDLKKSEVYYREYFPPETLNGFEIRWQRPVAVIVGEKTKEEDGFDFRWQFRGKIVAQKEGSSVELFPTHRDLSGLSELTAKAFSEKSQQGTGIAIRKLAEFSALLGKPISEEMANLLLASKKGKSPLLAEWVAGVAAASPEVASRLKGKLGPTHTDRVKPLTFARSVETDFDFESQYWSWIAALSANYKAQNNADCVPSNDRQCLKNELPDVSLYLQRYYEKLGLAVHRMPFYWEMDYEVSWWGGWALNSPKRTLQDIANDGHHNLIVVIPGESHEEAVILADHYDTAYMGDVYDGSHSPALRGHRHAAAGADDNHSATATLMAAAQILSQVPLKRDVWLVHLTGEEYPADCLGARALSESLVLGRPVVGGKKNPKIVGLYVLDMIAHNTDRDHVAKGGHSNSTFQISPGMGERSAKLAELMHRVTVTWNDLAGKNENEGWNLKYHRNPGWERVTGPGRPPQTLFPQFRGEIRLPWDLQSTLFNTDGQIFSDVGIPTVLMMENYDINRVGYHDTQDTLSNIDLDFGAGLSRIAIESVAQAACR